MASAANLTKLATKEKAAANVQITAEQLLREAAALQRSDIKSGPARLLGEDELDDHRVRKRKEFEDQLRRRRGVMALWLSYATWEAEQSDFRRARSIFERGLEVDHEHVPLWNKYLDMEIKNRFVNHARNLFDRVVHLMPRMDHFWLRYVAFEEILQMYGRVREIFEHWMTYNPEERAWIAYAKFEERCGELEKARKVLERFLVAHSSQASFLKVAQWETEQREYHRARGIFETGLDVLRPPELTERFFIKFAQFEEFQRRKPDEAKLVYQEGLRRLDGSAAEKLEQALIAFQKRQGETEEIERVLLEKRRRIYASQVESNFYDYDSWFSLLRLLEEQGNIDDTRAAYSRAMEYVPLEQEKRKWKRFVYICILYAVFEETTAKDIERAGDVYERLNQLIPHEKFSFAKVWKLWAAFEIRRRDLQRARLIFGQSIGHYPVEKVFRNYVSVELELGEIARARKICAKFIEIDPVNPGAWLALIDVELLVGEVDRARELFETAAARPDLQHSEKLWKKFIDIEANLKNHDRCKKLFERLFQVSNHWKALKGLAEFCVQTAQDIRGARDAYERAILQCKMQGLDAERAKLLEEWLAMEKKHGDSATADQVAKLLPRRIRKRKSIVSEDGQSTTFEEYTAYVFPEEETQSTSRAILEAALKWKKRKVES